MFKIFSLSSFLGLILILLSAPVMAGQYKNDALGVSFQYPDTLTLDSSNSSKSPLKIPFSYGKAPMNTSVLFKDTGIDGPLEAFMKAEHERQKNGGYFGQVKEEFQTLPSGQKAVQLTRKTALGTIYYFIFPIKGNSKTMALWHMSNDMADPNGEAVKAFNVMKQSLNVQN